MFLTVFFSRPCHNFHSGIHFHNLSNLAKCSAVPNRIYNTTNERLGIELHWEHRSFKEQGIDRELTA